MICCHYIYRLLSNENNFTNWSGSEEESLENQKQSNTGKWYLGKVNTVTVKKLVNVCFM